MKHHFETTRNKNQGSEGRETERLIGIIPMNLLCIEDDIQDILCKLQRPLKGRAAPAHAPVPDLTRNKEPVCSKNKQINSK